MYFLVMKQNDPNNLTLYQTYDTKLPQTTYQGPYDGTKVFRGGICVGIYEGNDRYSYLDNFESMESFFEFIRMVRGQIVDTE